MISTGNGGFCAERQRTGSNAAFGTAALFVYRNLGDGIEVHAQRREPGQLVVVLGLRSRFGWVLLWFAELVAGQLVKFPGNPVHVCQIITR